MWKSLSHENILPFHGVNVTYFQLALVYDLEQKRDIVRYLSENPRASRVSLVRKTHVTVTTA